MFRPQEAPYGGGLEYVLVLDEGLSSYANNQGAHRTPSHPTGPHKGASGRPVARILALAALGCLSGCNLGPRYQRPNVPPPAAYLQGAGEGVAAPGQTAAWPSAEWWQGFRSQQLNQLMTDARTANDDLGAAVARVIQADEQARIAGAALLPTLEADGSGVRQRQQLTGGGVGINPVNGLSTSATPPTFNSFNLGLSASYTLDFWGHFRALRDAARAAALASRYDRATVELTVETSVAVTYFEVLELAERLDVARDNVKHAQDTLDGLKLQLQFGIITALDVAQQQTTVATLEAAIPPLQQAYDQTFDALAILVGKTPESLAVNIGRLKDLTAPTVSAGLPAELLARRPDVAEAEANLISANANIRAARAAFLPSISLTADGGFASAALSGLVSPANRVFDIGASLSQPIFEGGALVGQYRLTKARYAELLSDYHKAVISAFSNVDDSLSALRQSGYELQRQQIATDTAQKAYDLSQEQLHAGTVNILTVLNTENALFTAQDALVQVRLAHLQSLVNLFMALGGGWERT